VGNYTDVLTGFGPYELHVKEFNNIREALEGAKSEEKATII
jgi:hypothetical protein